MFEAEPPQSVLEASRQDDGVEERPIIREREERSRGREGEHERDGERNGEREGEREGDRSISRSRPRKRNSIIQPRKESVAGPFAELAEYLHDYFSDFGALSGGDQRFEAMEASIIKIEEQVQRICERLDGGHTPPNSG